MFTVEGCGVDCDGYLAAVLKVIRENFRPDDPVTGSMTAAAAAGLVRHSLGIDWSVFGFAKFKDLLGALIRQGAISAGENSKHAYAIWLTPNPNSHPQVPAVSSTEGHSFPLIRRLRKNVWFAFVADYLAGRRFFHRRSGEVRVGLEHTPGEEWLEITPLNQSEEKVAASQFLDRLELSDDAELKASIANDRWYVDFPKALANRDPRFASEWKARRSQRIVSLVEKWCEANGVDSHLVYEPATLQSVPISPGCSPLQLRNVLLAAISRMSTDQLLDIRIPARFVIAELRPDLLDQ